KQRANSDSSQRPPYPSLPHLPGISSLAVSGIDLVPHRGATACESPASHHAWYPMGTPHSTSRFFRYVQFPPSLLQLDSDRCRSSGITDIRGSTTLVRLHPILAPGEEGTDLRLIANQATNL